jgi:SAM-dependent methyltransferase
MFVGVLLVLVAVPRKLLDHDSLQLNDDGLEHHAIMSDDDLHNILQDPNKTLEWQSSKAKESPAFVNQIDKAIESTIKKRFGRIQGMIAGKSVLCVGARAGGEVRAFGSLGAFSVGIDIFPADNGTSVLLQSADDIKFADSCVDVVYSNVLDHLPDLPAFASEVHRVLRPGGLFFVDIDDQTRLADEWAVRDTGTEAFYAEFNSSLTSAGLMRNCYTWHDPNREAWLASIKRNQGPSPSSGPSGKDKVLWRKLTHSSETEAEHMAACGKVGLL